MEIQTWGNSRLITGWWMGSVVFHYFDLSGYLCSLGGAAHTEVKPWRLSPHMPSGYTFCHSKLKTLSFLAKSLRWNICGPKSKGTHLLNCTASKKNLKAAGNNFRNIEMRYCCGSMKQRCLKVLKIQPLASGGQCLWTSLVLQDRATETAWST